MSPYEKECRLALLKAIYSTRLPNIPATEISSTYKEAKEVFTANEEAAVLQSIQRSKDLTCKLWE